MDRAVVLSQPGDGPFQRAMTLGLFHPADEELLGDQFLPVDVGGEIVLEAAGEMEDRLRRRLAVGIEEGLRAFPADFDAAEQIGLGARHLEQPRRGKTCGFAENLRVRPEAHLGAASIGDAAEVLDPADRRAARKDLPIKNLAARDLDFQPLGQGIDDRDADAMQPARGLIGPESNLPPAWSVVMMTSSADFFGNFGCGSTGMPRPLSVTDRKPSSSSATSMRVAWPATASSIELSSTSAKR